MGITLFINARIDAWMFLDKPVNQKTDEIFKRAEKYLAAGANGIFVPDNEDMTSETIKTLTRGIKAPLNIIAGKNSPSVTELKELGVKRITFGPRLMRALFTLLKEISREILEKGSYEKMSKSTIAYSEINRWFRNKPTANN